MDGSQPTHMKNVWRLRGDLSAPSRNIVASVREESLHFVEEHPPCGFGRRQQVVVAVECDQARSGYQRGELLRGGQDTWPASSRTSIRPNSSRNRTALSGEVVRRCSWSKAAQSARVPSGMNCAANTCLNAGS